MNNRKSLIYTSRSTLVGTSNIADEDLEYRDQQTLELERLEQEITLVLQDIDRNLGKANKVINDSLIPIINEYGKQSKKLFGDIKFWKNFFEDAAGVEVGGVENVAGQGAGAPNTGLQENSRNDIEIGDRSRDGEAEGDGEDEMMGDTTEGQSIINRYHNEVHNGEEDTSYNTLQQSMLKSTPKRTTSKSTGSQQQQPPSSPPPAQILDTTSAIFNNPTTDVGGDATADQEINFHEAYKVRLTPNKRPKRSQQQQQQENKKKSIFDDSPEILPPKLTSNILSPVPNRNGSKQQQQQSAAAHIAQGSQQPHQDSSLQMTASPPQTIQFAKSQQQEVRDKTPSRAIAHQKTNDLKDIIGANDSSSLQQIPPQFTVKTTTTTTTTTTANAADDYNKENVGNNSKEGYELDSILDNKFKQFNKTNNIDWSDDEDENNGDK